MTVLDLPAVLRPLFPLALDFGDEDADRNLQARAGAQLDLSVKGQEGNSLCWAAVTQAVLKYFGTVKSQCEIASKVLPPDTKVPPRECCVGGQIRKECDQAWDLDRRR